MQNQYSMNCKRFYRFITVCTFLVSMAILTARGQETGMSPAGITDSTGVVTDSTGVSADSTGVSADATAAADSTKVAADSTAIPEEAAWLEDYPIQARDTTGYFPHSEFYLRNTGAHAAVDMEEVNKLPYTSIDQMLIGRLNGVDVRTPSAEPGKRNSTFIRGASTLLLDNRDIYYAQPAFVVDGIPLIFDHPFAYDIQFYRFNRLGTEVNWLSFINVNDIESIEILKDFGASAKYGPYGANGVIQITTKGPRAGKTRVAVNSYIGMSARPQVDVTNGWFERNFRMQFYEKYANDDQWRNFPRYLADSTKAQYFGPANWDEGYFRNGLNSGIQADISGGSRLANFRFSLSRVEEQGVADKTGMERYNLNFGINIMPVKGLLLTTYVNGGTMNRHRSRFVRDRITDEDYLLNLESPLSPNKEYLGSYYESLGEGIDRNRSNSLHVLANLQYKHKTNFTVNSRFAINYGQNFRDVFIPTTLSDGNNFASNFDGLNRRMILDNSVAYHPNLPGEHQLRITLGNYLHWDRWRYDFGKGYKGVSDLIKAYLNENGGRASSNNFRLTANFKDFTESRLASFYGNISYSFAGKYHLGVYLREDGSSNVSGNNRWKLFPTVSASWDAKQESFLVGAGTLSSLLVRGSWGQVGRIIMDEYYRDGSLYNVELGWNGVPNMATYNGFPGINPAFSIGYVPDNITWPYVEQWNAGVDIGILDDRLLFSADVYSKTDRNLLSTFPVPAERGYVGRVENGMAIKNHGFEFSIRSELVNNRAFRWTSMLSLYANRNELLELPGGVQELVLQNGSRKLEVGKPADSYWILINEGIYERDADIPTDQQGRKMTYNGIALQAGDPRWKDLNGDHNIDDQDRVLKGRAGAAYMGGFANTFSYEGFELSLLLNYAFDRQLINEAMANRFDFANREGLDNIQSVKELEFWSKEGDYDKYPVYNPWSPVYAYQANQSLFMENASYVKLRSVTLSYQFTGQPWMDRAGINRFRIYLTGGNLYTWSDYSGGDPEAVGYYGYDEGVYNRAFPKTFTLGFNLEF